MLALKRWIRSFFGFSSSQTNGFIILLPLLTLILFSEPIFRFFFNSSPLNFENDRHQLDSLMAIIESGAKSEPSEPATHNRAVINAFNPNLVTAKELERMGLPKSIAVRIENYRSKGGKFRIKSDLLNIYGLDSVLYRAIESSVQLPEKLERIVPASGTEVVEDKEKTPGFNLNEADTAQLMKIYGIGPKLSSRIVRYREKLGGFLGFEQLYEVYSLDSTVIDRLRQTAFIPPDFVPRKININEATIEELATHPYLSKQEAAAIVAYRFQHGKYTATHDLINIRIVNAITLQKISPYLKLTD